jgi:hypothetical protein
MVKRTLTSVSLLILSVTITLGQGRPIWTSQKANEWYGRYSWQRGCNFIPHTAINQLEMWQAGTFDTAAIDHDLTLAQSVGFNSMRVFLHHVAWQEGPAGFKSRVSQYLSIAHRHKILTIFVFFDDCWNDDYHPGLQPAPRPGVHNSGWLRDPGSRIRTEPLLIDTLQRYVKDILSTFRHDKRILLWDLYNEPGNNHYGDSSLALLKEVFRWGREANPDQPLSAGVWNKDLACLNAYQLAQSDVITYHNYNPPAAHQEAIDSLRKFDRPLICTEYMARRNNSLFTNILPLLKREHVAAINWGLVMGKTNTIYAWDTPMPDGKEPKLWFHDVFRVDGRPFSEEEVKTIKQLTGTK